MKVTDRGVRRRRIRALRWVAWRPRARRRLLRRRAVPESRALGSRRRRHRPRSSTATRDGGAHAVRHIGAFPAVVPAAIRSTRSRCSRSEHVEDPSSKNRRTSVRDGCAGGRVIITVALAVGHDPARRDATSPARWHGDASAPRPRPRQVPSMLRRGRIRLECGALPAGSQRPVRADAAPDGRSTLLDERAVADAPPGGESCATTAFARWGAQPPGCSVALAAAVVLRFSCIAYPPALEFFGDSESYLAASQHPFRVDLAPVGYPFLVSGMVSATRSLGVSTTLQHLIGAAHRSGSSIDSYAGSASGGSVRRRGARRALRRLPARPRAVRPERDTVHVPRRRCDDVTARPDQQRDGLRAQSGSVRAAGAASLDAHGRNRNLRLLLQLLSRASASRVARRRGRLARARRARMCSRSMQLRRVRRAGLQRSYLYGIVAPFASCDRAALPVETSHRSAPALPTYARPGPTSTYG